MENSNIVFHSDESNCVLRVTEDGTFIWSAKAEDMIEAATGSAKAVLEALWRDKANGNQN